MTNSKKKGSILYHSNSKAACVIDNSYFEVLLNKRERKKDTIGAQLLVSAISREILLEGQIKAIHQHKGKIKVALSSDILTGDDETNGFLAGIEILVHLYLLPPLLPLRKSCEWIVDLISHTKTISKSLVRQLVMEACTTVRQTSILNVADQSIDQSLLSAYSFTAMTLLDRDLNWLDMNQASRYPIVTAGDSEAFARLERDSVLLTHLAALLNFAESLSSKLICGSSMSAHNITVHNECVCECLRAFMTALKSRRHLSLAALDNPLELKQWSDLCNQGVMTALNLLELDLGSKDLRTTAALALVCLQWLQRPSNSPQRIRSRGSLQLLAFCTCLAKDRESSTLHEHLLLEENLLFPVLFDRLSGEGHLGMLSRAALLRAFLAVYPLDSMMTTGKEIESIFLQTDTRKMLKTYFPGFSENTLLFGPLIDELVQGCRQADDGATQVYSLQTIDSWLAHIEDFISMSDTDVRISPISQSPEKAILGQRISAECSRMRSLAGTLITGWTHASKRVNHIIPALFTRLVTCMNKYCELYEFSESQKQQLWDPVVNEVLSISERHRARYQALTSLLPTFGVKEMLQVRPTLIKDLVCALWNRDTCSSLCSCVGSLLRGFHAGSHVELVLDENDQKNNSVASRKSKKRRQKRQERIETFCGGETNSQINEDKDKLYQLHRPSWLPSVAEALSASSSIIRLHAANYLLPEVLRCDPYAGPHLLKAVKERVDISEAQKQWGTINICLHIRLQGLLGGEISQVSGQGSLAVLEVHRMCTSSDAELRLTALTALTASQQKGAPLLDTEMEILRSTLSHSLKTSNTALQQQLLRVIKAMLTRLLEARRMSSKSANKMGNILRQSGQSEDSPSIETLALMDAAKKAQRACNAGLQFIATLIQDCLYPGTSPDKECIALDIFQTVLDVAITVSEISGDNTSSCLKKNVTDADKVLPVLTTDGAENNQCPFFTESMIHSALNLLFSSWDSSRRKAANLLIRMPRPLAGYSTADTVHRLTIWGVNLASSAKQRESEAGAMLLRLVFAIYCHGLGWRVIFEITNNSPTKPPTTYDGDISPETDILRAKAIENLISTSEGIDPYISLNEHLCFRLEAAQNGNEYLESFSKEKEACACLLFLNDLANLLNKRIISLTKAFSRMDTLHPDKQMIGDDFDLCHGLLQAVRYCLVEASNEGYLLEHISSANGANQSIVCTSAWKSVLRRLLSLSNFALETSLTVVAEARTDVPFSPVASNSRLSNVLVPGGEKSQGSLGPVNSTQDHGSGMAATYITANGIAGGTVGAEEEDCSHTAQHAVIAAWMLVKESSAMISTLIELSPSPSDKVRENGTRALQILNVSDISSAGFSILDALGRLKHMGAIAEVYSSLQSISSTLLRRDSSSELSSLPTTWLESVLRRLRLRQQVFILRRSAGFAYSFLALLRAEPSGCSPRLLPIACTELLNLAEEGMKEFFGWSSTVHAFNAMRLILVDAALAMDIDPYIDRALRLVVRGFSHERWAVRNSAMMVFASIVQRAVDNHKGSEASARGTTARAFFSRFPGLFEFLLLELAKITAHDVIYLDGKLSKVQPKSFSAKNKHTPALLPILLLLGKMRPEDSAKDTNLPEVTDFPMSLFVQLIEACASSQEQKIRIAAAAAINAFTPEDTAIFSASSRLNLLIVKLEQANQSSNTLHGSFLVCRAALQHLVNRHRQREGLSTREFSAVKDMLPLLWEILGQLNRGREGKSRPYLCPSVIRVFLDLCRLAATLCASEGKSIWIAACRYALWAIIPRDVPYDGSHDLLIFALPDEGNLWREALVDMVSLRCLSFHNGRFVDWSEVNNSSEFEPLSHSTLVSLMHHPHSEIRLGVLEGFQSVTFGDEDILMSPKLSKSESKGSVPTMSIVSALLIRCRKEKEASLLRIVYELLGLLLPQVPWQCCGESDLADKIECMKDVMSREEMWKHLFRTVCVSPDMSGDDSVNLWNGLGQVLSPDVSTIQCEGNKSTTLNLRVHTLAAGALQVMGICISLTPQDADVERLLDWLILVENASFVDQPHEQRAASITSLSHSNVLHIAAHLSDCSLAGLIVVRVWILVLRLLQDDDCDIRKSTASFISKENRSDAVCLEIVSKKLSDALVVTIAESAFPQGGVDETAGQKCFQLIVSELERAIGATSDIFKAVADLGSKQISQVFEKEQLNLHAESRITVKVLSQALVLTVHTLCDKKYDEVNIQQFRTSIMSGILHKAQSAVDILRASDQSDIFKGTSGGASFDERVFLWSEDALSSAASLLAGHKNYHPDVALMGNNQVNGMIEDVVNSARRITSRSTTYHPLLEVQLRKIAHLHL
eukprot:GSChrysophyteH1.ASY1.ANO1.1929.1 assembled CDS